MKIGLVVRPPGDEMRVVELREVVERLRVAGHEVHARMTFEGGDARQFARRCARNGCDLLLVAGGDGTVNEVVNAIARLSDPPRLGIVPFGTANDFAHGLGLPETIPEAVQIAVNGIPIPVDVGVVNGRCFINVSTGGFGADATVGAPLGLKRKLKSIAYLVTGAMQLIAFAPKRARFLLDGELFHDGEFVFFAVGNARRTGGGTFLTPRAEFQDGRLDVAIIRGISRIDFLALLPDLRAGTHLESPDVLYLRAKRLEICASTEVAVNVDGEPTRSTHFIYSVLPHPLHVMMPE